MIAVALLLLASVPTAEPSNAYDLIVRVGDKPAMRVRLKIEVGGKPLAALDGAAKRDRETLEGKPGVAALARLAPEGSLLRVEAAPSVAPHSSLVSKVIFNALDADGDGKLSAGELEKAESVLLRKFDLDGDECITPLELCPDLQTATPAGKPAVISVALAPVDGKPDLERTISLGRDGSYWRAEANGIGIEFYSRVATPAEKPATPKALFTAGREDAKVAFEKAAPGVVSIVAVPEGVGFFDRLDADRDGQVSVAELRRAKAVLAGATLGDTALSLHIVPGVAAPPAVPFSRTLVKNEGPVWFRSMDTNGDGSVSRREFLGTAEQFRSLDRNGDGLLSAEEAAVEAKPKS